MARLSLSSLPLATAPGRRPWLRALPWQRLQAWYLPLLLVALWWLASRNQWMSEQILPAPALVWHSALELAQGELWSHLAISLQRLLVGLLLGVA
ncbi:MAG: ABC transporter permease, partial [Pseudomonas sp.]